MKIGRLMVGWIAPVMAYLVAVTITVLVIHSEWIMFDRRDVNTLVATLAAPMLVQLIIYVVWFIKRSKGSLRNADKLAKEGLWMFLLGIAVGGALLFGLASINFLWEEGIMFLIGAAVLYVAAGLIQYIWCRPY